MSRMTPIAVGLALPLTFLSHAALADLTPSQVWSDWQSYMAGVGYQIEATETERGGDLTVSDVTLGFTAPEGAGSMEMSLGAIEFNQNGDGTVAIVLPDTMPIKITGEGRPGDAQTFDMTVTLTQAGHSLIASGSPQELTYVYDADSMTAVLDQVMMNGQGVENGTAKMNLAGTDINTTTTMTIGDLRGYDQSSTVASVSYSFEVETPEDGGQKADISGAISGLTVTGTGTLPTDMPEMTDMSAMLGAGFDISGNIAYQSGSSNFDVENPRDGSFKMQTSSQGGSLDVAVGSDGIAYGGGQQDLKMTVNVVGMPFPIEVAMADSAFNLAMPATKSDVSQDFAFGLTMGNFTMSDLLWGIFDAAGQLPRDPATVKLDLTGKAKVLVDFLNPEAAAGMPGAPGELEALNLNTLLVDAVGAKLEGSGQITMDGTGPSMVPGMGSPVGVLNFALAGGNGLIDKLVAMGFVPQEQAMGARMMMGMFAVPGDGPDTLKSKIEFTQDGQILANGQRIR